MAIDHLRADGYLASLAGFEVLAGVETVKPLAGGVDQSLRNSKGAALAVQVGRLDKPRAIRAVVVVSDTARWSRFRRQRARIQFATLPLRPLM